MVSNIEVSIVSNDPKNTLMGEMGIRPHGSLIHMDEHPLHNLETTQQINNQLVAIGRQILAEDESLGFYPTSPTKLTSDGVDLEDSSMAMLHGDYGRSLVTHDTIDDQQVYLRPHKESMLLVLQESTDGTLSLPPRVVRPYETRMMSSSSFSSLADLEDPFMTILHGDSGQSLVTCDMIDDQQVYFWLHKESMQPVWRRSTDRTLSDPLRVVRPHETRKGTFIRTRYGSNPINTSSVRKRMIKLKDKFHNYMQTHIRRGDCDIWRDNWLGDGPLRSNNKERVPIKQVLLNDMGCDLSFLDNLHSPQFQYKLLQSQLSLQSLVWIKPLVNGAKLNFDDSAIGKPRVTGCGGVLCNSNGKLIFGFSKHLGQGTNLEPEAFKLLHDLQMCRGTSFKQIIIDVDSEILISMVNGLIHTPWKLDVQIRKLRSMIRSGNFLL
ncbi:hypothetical protein ACH5RR_040928 [Cinchona calisaya]|uniref:RNase H type-1 domain-containing protein n=1 Tax=Cinchona calisaya TaxID=153742 RepID=A0ABD2XU23_9GENT